MREDDGRRLDHKVLEELRLHGVREVLAGARADDVARTLGLHRSTVYAWLARYRSEGCEALLARPVPGRPPALSVGQQERLAKLIIGRDARSLWLECALWTRHMVAALVLREFGVELSAVTIGRLLCGLGFASRHRPRPRGSAGRPGEAVVAVDDTVVRGGRAILVCAAGSRGPVRFAAYPDELTEIDVVDFCRRLLHDLPGPVLVVAGANPAYRSAALARFVASTDGRLRVS